MNISLDFYTVGVRIYVKRNSLREKLVIDNRQFHYLIYRMCKRFYFLYKAIRHFPTFK